MLEIFNIITTYFTISFLSAFTYGFITKEKLCENYPETDEEKQALSELIFLWPLVFAIIFGAHLVSIGNRLRHPEE